MTTKWIAITEWNASCLCAIRYTKMDGRHLLLFSTWLEHKKFSQFYFCVRQQHPEINGAKIRLWNYSDFHFAGRMMSWMSVINASIQLPAQKFIYLTGNLKKTMFDVFSMGDNYALRQLKYSLWYQITIHSNKSFIPADKEQSHSNLRNKKQDPPFVYLNRSPINDSVAEYSGIPFDVLNIFEKCFNFT